MPDRPDIRDVMGGRGLERITMKSRFKDWKSQLTPKEELALFLDIYEALLTNLESESQIIAISLQKAQETIDEVSRFL